MDKQKFLRCAAVGGAIIAVLLIAIIIILKINAPRIIQSVGEMVVARSAQSVTGKLSVGEINLSLFGATVIHNVILTDNQGVVVASSDELAVDYSLTDLIQNNLNIDNIKTISLTGLKLNLVQDRSGHWNIEDLMKPSGQPLAFRGKINIAAGTATVQLPQGQFELSSLEGNLNFANYPSINADLTGKQQNTALKVRGSWTTDGPLTLTVEADTVALAQIQPFMPPSADLALQSGEIKGLSLTLNRDNQSVLLLTGKGSFSGLAASLNGMELSTGQGNFTLTGQTLELSSFSLAVAGQQITGSGEINFAGPSPQVNLSLAAQNFNPATVQGLSTFGGAINFAATLTGPVDHITAQGSFQIPSGTLGSTAFSSAAGTFQYADDILTLQQGTVTALGGPLTFAGTYNTKTAFFNQQVGGQNIDSALVTDNALPGRVNFNVAVSGTGISDMVADGTFSMGAGTISTIAFSSMSGSFAKKGTALELKGVNIVTDGQSLYAQGLVLLEAAKIGLDLQISSATAVDLTAFQPAAPLKGPVAFQASILGTADNYSADGRFQIASGSFGRINFAAASGAFHYAGDVLTIHSAKANALGGTITTAGTIVKSTGVYNQQVTGQNVEAGFFTDGDVNGRTNFTAQIAGQNDWDNASADGSFSIKAGAVKGLQFSNMTGNFKKRGRQSDISNLKLQLAGGLVNATAFSEGDYIRLKLTPSDSPFAQLLGPALTDLIPQQEMMIKFRGAQ